MWDALLSARPTQKLKIVVGSLAGRGGVAGLQGFDYSGQPGPCHLAFLAYRREAVRWG